MQTSRIFNLFLLQLGVMACGLSVIGALASFMAWISSDLSGPSIRFLFGFSATSTLLFAGSHLIRETYRETFQRFREANDDFWDSMR
jgi:hypothetical protein